MHPGATSWPVVATLQAAYSARRFQRHLVSTLLAELERQRIVEASDGGGGASGAGVGASARTLEVMQASPEVLRFALCAVQDSALPPDELLRFLGLLLGS